MTPERFHTLLHTYGADLRRWPESERAAAAQLVEHGPVELRQAVAEAARLDGWLDSHQLPEAGSALTRRILAGAPVPAAPARASRRTPSWWAGAGLAAIGLAGSLAGAFAVSLVLQGSPAPAADWEQRSTAFGGLPTEGSEE